METAVVQAPKSKRVKTQHVITNDDHHTELYDTRMTRQEQLLYEFQKAAEEAQTSEYGLRKMSYGYLIFEIWDNKWRRRLHFEPTDIETERSRERGIDSTNTESDSLITQLTSELEALRQQNQHMQSQMAEATGAVEERNNYIAVKESETKALQEKVESQRKDIRKYKSSLKQHKQDERSMEAIYSIVRQLTGTDVEIVSQNSQGQQLFLCKQTGKNGTVRYHLGLDGAESPDFAYQIITETDEDKKVAKLLPEYLRGSITFARKEVSTVILQQIYSSSSFILTQAISFFNKISVTLAKK